MVFERVIGYADVIDGESMFPCFSSDICGHVLG